MKDFVRCMMAILLLSVWLGWFLSCGSVVVFVILKLCGILSISWLWLAIPFVLLMIWGVFMRLLSR